jgi:ABC-2 type transport system ATP-binding protein
MKSTLIKSIAGLLEPTSGSITVDGNDIATHPEEAKKVLGYIPDEPSIWSHMTGEEFLYFTQALYNTEESGRDAAIQELLARFSLSGIEKTNFEDYSRGNKQKFSILAAFSHTPKLLLIDEPIVGLDPIGADIAKKMFKDFAQAAGADVPNAGTCWPGTISCLSSPGSRLVGVAVTAGVAFPRSTRSSSWRQRRSSPSSSRHRSR